MESEAARGGRSLAFSAAPHTSVVLPHVFTSTVFTSGCLQQEVYSFHGSKLAERLFRLKLSPRLAAAAVLFGFFFLLVL